MEWIAVGFLCCWVSWLSGAYCAESRGRRELATLGRQLEKAMTHICNLDGENGVLKDRLARTQANALRTMRASSELARSIFDVPRPKVDEIVILGDPETVFAETERLELA